MEKTILRPWAASLLAPAAILVGCGSAAEETFCPDDSVTERPDNWEVASHCPGVDADYARIFEAEQVHPVTIVMTADHHQETMDDLDEKYSGGSPLPDLDALPDAIYVPVTVQYDGKTWDTVGMRYKGHSSLKAAWQSGIRKLSFRLSFDHYEELDVDEQGNPVGDEPAHPALADQRFWGFKTLSFSNSFNDPSLIRDRVGGDVFRDAGVPAAKGAYAAVTLDWGGEDGPVYMGLYTIIEDPADEMLDDQFGEDAGNMYKPWSDPARLIEASDADVETYFEPQRNELTTDWDDVKLLIERLNADRSDAAAWRASLESVFDVPGFLEALAVNQVMMNWDSYGCMHHNYYLYGALGANGDRRLTYVPWDLNESMLERTQSGCRAPGSVLLDEIVNPDPAAGIDTDWPLIAFILGDPVYHAAYVTAVREVLDGAFAADAVIARMRSYHDLIAPWVVGPDAVEARPYTNTTPDAFAASLTGGDTALETHVANRHTAVEAALAAAE